MKDKENEKNIHELWVSAWVIFVCLFFMMLLFVIIGFNLRTLFNIQQEFETILILLDNKERDLWNAQNEFNKEVVKQYNLHAPQIINITAEVK